VIDRRFARFLAVGVLNTVFGYTVYALLLFAGLHYATALLLATVVGVLFNFRSTGRLVFGNRDDSRLWRFMGVYLFCYLLNIGCLRLLDTAGLGPYVAQGVLLPPLTVAAFALNHLFVFGAGPGHGER
jgi:putative flippase GtrA